MADEPEVTQSTNPLITEPTQLSPDALAPASDADILDALTRAPATPPTEKRKPGRPLGSKNKPREQGKPSAGRPRMVTPPKTAKPEPTPEELERVARRKRSRAKELEGSILTTLNDNILDLVQMMGVPAQMLYVNGVGKPTESVNPNYTQVGNMLAIQPQQAAVWGKFLAELESTDVGSKVSGATSSGKAPLLVYGLLSLAMGFQYAQAVNTVMTQARQMAEAMRDYQAQQTNEQAAAAQAQATAQAQPFPQEGVA